MESAGLPLSREKVVRDTLEFVRDSDITVTSLGGLSRELYMVRKEQGKEISQNFFCIGAMGHSFALANGLAIGRPEARRIWCLDGDGSFIMHLGNNAVLAGMAENSNVVHIVVYNGVYSSTGSQPLMIDTVKFLDLAEGLPYRKKIFVDNNFGLRTALVNAIGGTLIVVLTNDQMSDKLPRPTETAAELKDMFVGRLHRADEAGSANGLSVNGGTENGVSSVV